MLKTAGGFNRVHGPSLLVGMALAMLAQCSPLAQAGNVEAPRAESACVTVIRPTICPPCAGCLPCTGVPPADRE